MSPQLPLSMRDPDGSAFSLRTHAKYMGIRLLALLGILMLLEKGFTSWSSAHEPLPPQPRYGLHPHAFKDGDIVPALSTSTYTPKKSKAIIAASMKHDNTSWMHEFLPDWEKNIYVMDSPEAEITVTKNKGNEGAAYLTYLITHYHALPEHMIFVHARRYQWHNDDPMYDHVPIIQKLRLGHVSEVGYASLRCMWKPGCRVEVTPDLERGDGFWGYHTSYAKAWEILWPGTPIPKEIGAPCCAQFAVSRQQVLKRPVKDYERLRQWLWDTELHPLKSGRIMEYSWHILFGQDAISCPTAEDCYCKTFGLCELDCPVEGSCDGRYTEPYLNEPLPENWPQEGQGKNGWPVDQWWNKTKNHP